MATGKGLEALAVGELQIQHPAVGIDQGKSVQLALVALIVQDAEVAPIHFEAFSGRRFHADEGALGLQPRPDVVEVSAQDGVAAGVAQRAQSLFDDRCARPRIFLQ